MTEWKSQPAPVDTVSELRAASRLYNSPTFADAADELERLRPLADHFRAVAQAEYEEAALAIIAQLRAEAEQWRRLLKQKKER